jgi:hypothetical protein
MCRDTAVHVQAVGQVRRQATRFDPVALHDQCRKPPFCGEGDHRFYPRGPPPAGDMQQGVCAPVGYFGEGRDRIIRGPQKEKTNLDTGLLRSALGLLNITRD